MFKTKLQELCHEKKWGLPRYTAMKDGPEHSPRFKASVSVHGFFFDSPIPCKSSKEAQNQASMLAFLHFTSPPSSSGDSSKCLIQSDASSVTDGLCHQYKSQLQNYAQSKNLDSSLYSSKSDGPPLADESGHYKNLLQELVQKEGFCMPAYTTVKSGASHMPIFSSTVEVEGERFCGEARKSKKQAELNAAKVAYTALKERGLSRTTELTSPDPIQGALKTTQISDLTMTVDSLQNLIHEHQLVSSPATKYEECAKEIKVIIDEVQESSTPDKLSTKTNLKAEDCNPSHAILHMDNMNTTGNYCSCSESVLPSTEENPSSPTFKQPNRSAFTDSDTNVGKSEGLRSYLLCNRVRVYTQFPDIAFPSSITVLPISDGKWVAFSLEFPNEASN